MGQLFIYPLDQLPFLILVVILAFTVHEFAHAYVADLFGDPTPRSMGRVTLNPRPHMDILGMLLILLVGFGWARPVLIRSSNFRKPRLMSAIVSLAGPLSNLLLAFAGVFIAFMLSEFNVYDKMSYGVLSAVIVFLQTLIMLNLRLFIFNLLPLPPLDGYRIISELIPYQWRARLQRLEQWALFIFLLLLFLGPLQSVIINLSWDLLLAMNRFFTVIFGNYGQLSDILLPV